jgi:hypothetical protein
MLTALTVLSRLSPAVLPMTLRRRDENMQLVSEQKVAEFMSVRHSRNNRLMPINSTLALGYSRKCVGVVGRCR